MLLEFRFDFSPLTSLAERLDSILDLTRPGPFRDAVLEAMDLWFDFLRQRYDANSVGGGDWAPHAPSTVARRGEGALILVELGDLRDSMERGDPNHVLDVLLDRIVEGTADPKARFHQDGAPSTHLPARQIVVEPDAQVIDAMRQVLARGFVQAIKDAIGSSPRPLSVAA